MRTMPPVRRLLASILAGASSLAACAGEPASPAIELARLRSVGCVAYEGQPVDRACVPRAARENARFVLELEERCGSCATTVERCAVRVEGKEITLSLDGRSCNPREACADVCTKRRVACEIPPLPGGRYALRYADGSGRVDVLEVAAGGAVRCALDDGA